MFRRCALVLALVSALTGCVASPPKGAFVEYSEGLTPITRPVKCEATYALRSTDRCEQPLTAHQVMTGERIGFRREADGSVTALAPGYTLPLAPGAYVWEVIPEPPRPWHERAREYTRNEVRDTTEAIKAGLLIGGIVVVALGVIALYAYASSNTPGAYR